MKHISAYFAEFEFLPHYHALQHQDVNAAETCKTQVIALKIWN